MSNEHAETLYIDRTGWPAGPWSSEPDRVEFEHGGFPCLILRQSVGHLCGYVAVPPGHPAHGKGYGHVYDLEREGVEILVHGGLTYADKCGGHVCHVPKPGQPDDVWWLGFDCAHCDDLSPARIGDSLWERLAFGRSTYKTVDYVSHYCRRLADTLAKMAVQHV